MINQGWESIGRPGYFGRRRDEIIAGYNEKYGQGNWRLAWVVTFKEPMDSDQPKKFSYGFAEACRLFYEESYYRYLKDRKEDIDFICSFGECIDNGMDNIKSGLDYTIQTSYSTHIQDICVRNILNRLGRKFEGPEDKILVIRSSDSNGYRFGPGNIPFYDKSLITQPSKCPSWAHPESVEDFWQSNKRLQVRNNQLSLTGASK